MSQDFMFDITQAATLLSMMANDHRLRVFELITTKEWDVGALAKEVDISQSALSQHLKKMRDLNLVHTRREGQTMFYSCRADAIKQLLETLREIAGTEIGALKFQSR